MINICSKLNINKIIEVTYFAIFLFLLLLSGSSYLGDFDAGEFYRIAITGGISHPPGYPIYNALNQLIFFITKSKSVYSYWGINVIFTTLTAWLAYNYLLRPYFGIKSLISLSIVVTAPSIWRASTNIEPFALHHLFVIIGMILASKLATLSNSRKYWFSWGLMFGLAICHHHIFAMLLPGTLWCLRKHITPDRIGSWIFGSLVGLLPLSYFYFSINGGYVWNNWESFAETLIKHLLRIEYGTFNLTLGSTTNSLWDNFHFFEIIILQLGVFAIFFTLIGAYQKIIKGSILLMDQWLLSGIIFSGPIFLLLANLDKSEVNFECLTRFFGTFCWLILPFLAIGLNILGPRKSLYGILLVVFQGVTQLPINWRANETFSEDHIENIIMSAQSEGPTDAVVVTFSDLEFFTFEYYKTKYGLPKEMTIVQGPLWGYKWYQKQFTQSNKNLSLPDWLKLKISQDKRVYLTELRGHIENLTNWAYPVGTLIRLAKTNQSINTPLENYVKNTNLLKKFKIPNPHTLTGWEKSALHIYYQNWLNIAKRNQKIGNSKIAAQAFNISSKFKPEQKVNL